MSASPGPPMNASQGPPVRGAGAERLGGHVPLPADLDAVFTAAGAAAWGAVSYARVAPLMSPENRDRAQALCPGAATAFAAAFPYYAGTWNYICICAVFFLAVPGILQPFMKETTYICIVCRSTGKNLGVSRPAETFISLRTICRYTEIIAALPPKDITEKLIDIFIRSFNETSFFIVRSNDITSERENFNIIIRRYFYITESVKCE